MGGVRCSLWKRRWWCAGLGGGGRRRSLDGGDALEVEVGMEVPGEKKEGEKTSKCCQSKKDGGWKGARGVKSRS